MPGPIFGTETEYAVMAGNGRDVDAARDRAVSHMLERARTSLANLPSAHGSGYFLSNGSRLYVDAGSHPEFATPEVTNPWDAVRYARAGDAIMLELSQWASANGAPPPVLVMKNNVDFLGNTTWGAHESYGHRSQMDRLAPLLVPHLVSRIIYTGAGGFSTRGGFTFSVSPRAAFLGAVKSDKSMSDRAIINLREEPLAGDGHARLHLICGESLHSDTAAFLRVATTALIVALIDAGKSPGATVPLAKPVAALKAFAADVDCKVRVASQRWSRISAIDIQRHYLAEVEACIGEPFLPAWAKDVCALWRETLDRLQGGHWSVAQTLDWAIRYAVFSGHIAKRGSSWDELAVWGKILAEMKTTAALSRVDDRSLSASLMAADDLFVVQAVDSAKTRARASGLDWNGFDGFLKLRAELVEADMRFAQLGPDGIFARLDSAGSLDHRLAGIGQIADATHEPPRSGRAAVRGQFIARVAKEPQRYTCTWDRAFDRSNGRMLDLSDAFVEEEHWCSGEPLGSASDRFFDFCRRRAARGEPAGHGPNAADAIDWNNRALSQRDRALRVRREACVAEADAMLEEAELLLRNAVLLETRELGVTHPKVPHRMNNLGIILILRGQHTEAQSLLARAWELQRSREHDITGARILFVQVMLQLATGHALGAVQVSVPLGQIKTLLAPESLANAAEVDRSWNVASVVEEMRESVTDEAFTLLAALLVALNNTSVAGELEQLRVWREQAPVSLSEEWFVPRSAR